MVGLVHWFSSIYPFSIRFGRWRFRVSAPCVQISSMDENEKFYIYFKNGCLQRGFLIFFLSISRQCRGKGKQNQTMTLRVNVSKSIKCLFRGGCIWMSYLAYLSCLFLLTPAFFLGLHFTCHIIMNISILVLQKNSLNTQKQYWDQKPISVFS